MPDNTGGTANFTLAPSITRQGDEPPLDADGLAKILAARLVDNYLKLKGGGQDIAGTFDSTWKNQMGFTDNSIQSALQRQYLGLAKQLAQLLPDQARYASIAQRLDLRPLLARVMITSAQYQTEVASSKNPYFLDKVDLTVNGVGFSGDQRLAAAQAFLLQQQLTDAQTTAIIGANDQLQDPAKAAAFRQQMLYGWHNDAGRLDLSEKAIGEAMMKEATTGTASPSLGKSGVGNYSIGGGDDSGIGLYLDQNGNPLYFTDAQLSAPFKLDEVSWSDILKNERYKALARAGGVTDGTNPTTISLSGVPGAADGVTDTFDRSGAGDTNRNIVEAANFIYTRSPDEVRTLQQRLKDAGYFEGTGDPTVWGSATDQATQVAWRRLVMDSAAAKTGVGDLLAQRVAFRQKDPTVKQDIVLTDAAGIRQAADTVAQQLLGRNLDDTEMPGLVSYIHQLEQSRQANLNQSGGQVEQNVDVQAQIAERIKAQHPDQVQGHGVLDQFARLRSMIGLQ